MRKPNPLGQLRRFIDPHLHPKIVRRIANREKRNLMYRLALVGIRLIQANPHIHVVNPKNAVKTKALFGIVAGDGDFVFLFQVLPECFSIAYDEHVIHVYGELILTGTVAKGAGLGDALLCSIGFIFYLVGELHDKAFQRMEFFSGAFDEVIGARVYLRQN